MKQIPQSSDPGGQAAAHGASAEDLLKTIESQCFIWETVVSDPATGVALMDRDGRLLYINKQSVRFLFTDNLTPEEIIGKTIAELGFPEDWVAERLRISAEIIDSGESILLRTVWQGHQQFSWMRSIQSENPGDLGRVLAITRRVVAGEESEHLLHGEYEVIESSLIRLGKLDVLTSRELEVLALVGQGMSTKQIAEVLFRSAKTIENHRESISKKFGRVQGVELARIAREAGLLPSDHDRKRV
ncbi:MAG: hypothetical protein JKY96_05100 [Phycisphaerales bacterium]|nr:hypothetical protein [Phycisphaerales bacterium]